MRLKSLWTLIPLPRVVLYLFIIGLIPVGYLVYDFSCSRKHHLALLSKIESVHASALQKKQKQALNLIVRQQYADSDPLFLERSLSHFKLLKKEKESLDTLLKNPAFIGSDEIEQRYHFLSSEKNRFRFSPSLPILQEGIQETEEPLSHPVEVDGKDLKEILYLIETKHPLQPQLLITDLQIQRKKNLFENEVFDLDFKILKREFVSP